METRTTDDPGRRDRARGRDAGVLATGAALAIVGLLLAVTRRAERRDRLRRARPHDHGGGVCAHPDGRIEYSAAARAAGRHAVSPGKVPSRGWHEIFWRVVAEFQRDRVPIVAAGVTFYAVLSLFPLITAFVTLFGILADRGQVAAQLSALEGVVPPVALSLVSEQVHRLLSVEAAQLTRTSVLALLVALWTANLGVKGLIEAMNVAHDEHDRRGFLRRNLTALSLTLGAMAIVATLISLSAILPALIALFPGGPLRDALLLWGRWPLMAALLTVVLALLYRFGPDRRAAKWRWITPGALVAALGLIAVSWAFSIYATRVANFSETHGSLGTAVAMMIWLWLGAIVVIVGAEINAQTEHQTAEDSTIGRDRPLGARRAAMADKVAPGLDRR